MAGTSGFDLTKGNLPLVFAFGLFVAVGAGCIKVGEVLARYERRESEIVQLAAQVAALQRTLLTMRLDERWQRSDQVLFCWEAERINQGWRCPAIRPAPTPTQAEVPRESPR